MHQSPWAPSASESRGAVDERVVYGTVRSDFQFPCLRVRARVVLSSHQSFYGFGDIAERNGGTDGNAVRPLPWSLTGERFPSTRWSGNPWNPRRTVVPSSVPRTVRTHDPSSAYTSLRNPGLYEKSIEEDHDKEGGTTGTLGRGGGRVVRRGVVTRVG